MQRLRFHADPESIQLPRPPAAPVHPHAFMLFPAVACCPRQLAFMHWLYQQAFERAQAVARPSIVERDLCGVWN
jgi:hypothetical protein